MKRRHFLQSMLYGTAVAGPLSGLLLPSRLTYAAVSGNPLQRTLINTMLLGGADLRYLFAPAPGTAYADKFWQKRQNIYKLTEAEKNRYLTYDDLWQDHYEPVVASDGSVFGIHKSASWLRQQYEASNVAIIANVIASGNRRHDHSQLIMHTGDLQTSQFLLDRDGWGGRLLNSMPTPSQANIIAMSHDVGIYCNSTNPANRLDHTIHMRDSRNFSLPEADAAAPLAPNSIMARALKAYYGKRGEEVEQIILNQQLPENWPYRRFFQHESSLRRFGIDIDRRLEQIMPVQPAGLSRLYDEASPFKLHHTSFGKQLASLYDAMLCADLLKMRSAYLELGSWDTHRDEKTTIEGHLHDLFGIDGGLDSLARELVKTPGMVENLVLTFTSDFGRQLAANGTNGTDHGSGTYMIVVGVAVNGGTYGKMFPQREIMLDATGKAPYDQQGADILGLTSFERVLSEVCDWVEPGSGKLVFPNMANVDPTTGEGGPILEDGVDLSLLFHAGHYISGKISTANGEAYNYQDMTVTLSGTTDILVTVPVDANGVYLIGPLANGSYTLTPNKQHFVFSPDSVNISLADGNVSDVDFTANPLLQIVYAVKHSSLYTGGDGNQYRIMQAIGYNFIPDQTQVSIGGTPVFVIAEAGYFFTLAPPELSSGEIVVTTPTEQYIHPVLYEDLGFV